MSIRAKVAPPGGGSAAHLSLPAQTLARLFDAAPVGMLVAAPDGRALYINPAFTSLLGHEIASGSRIDIYALIHADDSGAARQHLERLARGEVAHYRGEHRLAHSDGHPIWISLAAGLTLDASGRPEQIILQITSIELQKRAEAALAHSESRLNFALESGRQGVWDHDIVNDTMYYSRMWRVMRGIPPDEEIDGSQESWIARIHPDDLDYIRANVDRQDKGDDTLDALEYRERTRDGRYIWILSRGRPVEWDEHGNPTRTLGTDTDITHIKLVEQELAAEKERLRVTLEAIADGMIATDARGLVTFMNPAAERLVGYTDAGARGLPVDTIFPLLQAATDLPARCPARICLELGQTIEAENELVLVGHDGVNRDIRCSASPVISGGRIEGSVLVFQDVSQSRALQRQLAHSASHDNLTGLPNRAAFDRALATANASAQGGRRHCLLYIDLDNFKPVNDTSGHAAGDALLKQVAQTIRGVCRSHDLAARIGGDEFAVILEDCPLPGGKVVAEKILRAIGALVFSWTGREYRVGASIGVSTLGAGPASALDALGEADAACYAAKGSGRGKVVAYAEISSRPADQP
jgi:diguanylate cyclase (GGDEF)-like protein/PAS domain S-box-containing protein